jgi:hypothetical protein
VRKEGENMSKADEMFEKLGYTKSEEPLDFYGKKIPYISYNDDMNYKSVDFNLEDRFFCVSCINKDFDKVIQAINEKVKELRLGINNK